MPAPTTIADLLDRVRKSGLIPSDKLDGFLVGLNSSGQAPTTPAQVLERLVAAGMITRFHAERLAAGKYKGFQLGSYLILDQLGTGGMGQVYLAEHLAMRRLVALKVLPVFSSDDSIARERFLREARASATLDHPNIVRIFDLCQDGKLLYLVMEYVEGINLQGLVNRTGPLPIAAACQYARQVAFGLQHAYEMGFVHRDIKPANLLLDRSGVVKILDLGLVRSESDAAAGLTRQLDNKTVLGTADYVAPEQAVDSSNVDIRADIYSLGATLYFLLTGRPLFPEGRTAQKLVWQQIKDPVPVARLRPEVPAELAEVVHVMLHKRPQDRFQTPIEVFDVLAAWAEEPVAPPAENLMPHAPARVAMARTAVPGAAAPSSAGSTSQVVATVLRTGVARPTPTPVRLGSNPRESHVVIGPPSSPSGVPGSQTPTHAMTAEDTQWNPGPKPPPPVFAATPESTAHPSGWRIVVAVAALTAAVALAALGVVVLLTRS